MRNYIQFGDLWVAGDTCEKFARFLNEAWRTKRRVKIRYKEGYEDFTGYHSKDGLTKYCTIGRSTGEIKIPLEIPSVRSIGGPGLLTSKDVVKSWEYVK